MLWWTIQQLKSRDVEKRLLAVEKLSVEDSLKAGEALIEAFSDPEESVRKAAAKALGSTRNELFLQPLGRALNAPDSHMREAAADALRWLKKPEGVSHLVPALADPVPAVRWQAARALESLGWMPHDKLSAARFAVARGKIEEAAAYGPEAVEAMSLILQDGAYHQRLQAVASLANIADARVVKALLVALKDKDDQVRAAAVEALCRIADPTSADALVMALKDRHKQVRAVAAEALGRFGDAKAVEPLLNLVNDKQWEVREAVCVALGRLRPPRALDALVDALEDADREVREAAVRGLSLLNDARAIRPLIGALVDEQDSVRQVALNALSTLDLHWERTTDAHDAMPILQEALKHGEYWVRQSAADALARIGSMGVAEQVPAVEVAPVLIEPGHIRKQATVQVLIGLLRDFDHELRYAAAEALGRLGQSAALPALFHTLEDDNSDVRRAAAVAVETLHGKPTADTKAILQGEDFPL